MGNPLLAFWLRLLGQDDDPADRTPRSPSTRLRRRIPMASAVEAEATIFLILRRMRTPLIVLITIFAVSVLGLTLIPGQDGGGAPTRMSFFDAFYFMSYTASTIGFGELPNPFTPGQRLWVTAAIYLTVIGWAYAIGSLLALVQDRAFRRAIALQSFTRKVKRLREPFLLIVGHGRTGELLCRSFDALGKRVVVIDVAEERIEALELGSYRSDVPGLVADGRDPGHLGVAGLRNPRCEAVLALTDDDEANLAVAITAALLRPDLPVIARTVSPTAADRIRAFGTPTVVNAFDRFGDNLRVAMRAPASHQLMIWLESGPGAELPERGRPPGEGHWVVCGYGRFGREVTADLRDEGLDVTVVDPRATPPPDSDVRSVEGSGNDPDVLERAGVRRSVGFVAGTDNDTTNLSMAADARRLNPSIFVAARQNRPSSAPLFAAMGVDSLLVPAEVVAHEVFAQLSTPLLWRFIQQVPAQGDAWAVELIRRISDGCGRRLPALWKIRLNRGETPALVGWLASGEARLGDVLRDPENREDRLAIVVLMVLRRDGEECLMAPADDLVLAPDDEMLLIGRTAARRALDLTMLTESAREYVQTGRRVPTGWLWRRLARSGVRRVERLS